MKNPYDEKRERKLTYILSAEYREEAGERADYRKAAVFVHLYYPDTLERYFAYIRRIPKEIAVFISVSREDTRALVLEQVRGNGLDHCRVVCKENNRGRDISSLLVAFRRELPKYEYICFLHDKKPSAGAKEEMAAEWVTGMWENMAASAEYIANVLQLLEREKEIGVLAPPEPLFEQFSMFRNTWAKDFAITKKLAEELELTCGLDEEKPPITLGTVFWCRTAALRKLFGREWRYEDFAEEPMPGDGTVSHGIERCLSFVAQDAGYFTGEVMTAAYAGKHLTNYYDLSKNLIGLSKSFFHYVWKEELLGFADKRKEIEAYCQSHSGVYIYGTGVNAHNAWMLMNASGAVPRGFVVSDGYKTAERHKGLPVHQLSELRLEEGDGLVVAVRRQAQEEVADHLRRAGIDSYLMIKEWERL